MDCYRLWRLESKNFKGSTAEEPRQRLQKHTRVLRGLVTGVQEWMLIVLLLDPKPYRNQSARMVPKQFHSFCTNRAA